jgi:hypothetical protein
LFYHLLIHKGRKKCATIDASDVPKLNLRFATLHTWDFKSNEIMEGLFSLFYRPKCLLVVTFNITEANFAKQFRKWMLFIKACNAFTYSYCDISLAHTQASRENSDVLVIFTHIDKLQRADLKKANSADSVPQSRYSAEIVAVLKANEDITKKYGSLF